MARQGRGTCGIVVAALAAMGEGPRPDRRFGAKAGRRPAQAARGRAGQLREGQGLGPSIANEIVRPGGTALRGPATGPPIVDKAKIAHDRGGSFHEANGPKGTHSRYKR